MAITPTVLPGGGGASPIPNNVGSSNPTIPVGAIVDNGTGPKVNAPSLGGLINQPGAMGPAPSTDTVFSRLVPRPAPKPLTPEQQSLQAASAARNNVFKSLQSSIDGINKTYDTKIDQYNQGQGANNAGATRAASALLGLSGSTGATARSEATTKVNATNTDAINAERSQRIASLIASVNEQGTASYNAAADQTLKSSQKTVQDQNDQAEKFANATVQALSTELPGVSFDQFRATDPQTFQKLSDLYGGNIDKMHLAWNAANGSQIKYDTTSVPGYAIYTDSTGKINALKIDKPAGYDLTVSADGTPLLFNKDTGDVKIATGFEKGSLAKDQFQVVKGTSQTDANGQPYTTADRVFDTTTGKFVDGQPGTAPDGSSVTGTPGAEPTAKNGGLSSGIDHATGKYIGPSIENGASPSDITTYLSTGPTFNAGKGAIYDQATLYNSAIASMLGAPDSSIGGMGSVAGRAAIGNKKTAIMAAFGLTQFDVAAAQQEYKALGAANVKIVGQDAFIKTYTGTATDALNLASKNFDAVGNTPIKIANNFKNWVAGNFTPAGPLAALETNIYTAAREYAKVTGGSAASSQALTDAASKAVDNLLNSSQSPEAFHATVTQMENDMKITNDNFDKQIASFAPNVGKLLGINPTSNSTGDLKSQATAAGYDYDAMRAEGYTDDQIKAALNSSQ